ncbi:hypothetical protein [Agromyces sp. NPDC058110]|uniref:hypothetical protein n=1 Tax=Agromyces sp. NPDC058110 TaxID=3346345 RepID=UPI0036DA07F7
MTATQNLTPGTTAAGATSAGATSTAATATPTTSTTTTAAAPVAPPSIHVRALLTWIAIFPLVTVGLSLIAPVAEQWPPVLRALVLTIVVVPLAVYLVVPQLLKAHGGLARRRAARRG